MTGPKPQRIDPNDPFAHAEAEVQTQLAPDDPFAAAEAEVQATAPKGKLANAFGGLAAAAHGAGQEVTMGLSDELAGLGRALIPGGMGYTEGRDSYRRTLHNAE